MPKLSRLQCAIIKSFAGSFESGDLGYCGELSRVRESWLSAGSEGEGGKGEDQSWKTEMNIEVLSIFRFSRFLAFEHTYNLFIWEQEWLKEDFQAISEQYKLLLAPPGETN